jgi:hypothetical protein
LGFVLVVSLSTCVVEFRKPDSRIILHDVVCPVRRDITLPKTLLIRLVEVVVSRIKGCFHISLKSNVFLADVQHNVGILEVASGSKNNV